MKSKAIAAAKAKRSEKFKEQMAATQQTMDQTCDWTQITEDDVVAVLRGKGDKKTVEVIRRTKGPDGKYLDPKKDGGEVLTTVLTTFLLSNKSTMSGAGNIGTGKDFKIHHGNAHFSIGLKIGNLKDRVPRREGGEDLMERQRRCMARLLAIARKIMGSVFDLNAPQWKLPIDRAYGDARKALAPTFKDKEGKLMAAEYTDLPDLEENDAKAWDAEKKEWIKIKEAVRNKAREMFIKNARSLPGEKSKEDNVERDPIIYVKRKCWPFKEFDPKTDTMSTEEGPSLVDNPIDLEHWPKIEQEMTDPKGKMRRKYNPIEYADGISGVPIPRPRVRVVVEEVDLLNGTRNKAVREIDDPFFDPCLVGASGSLRESLVALKAIWSVFRGPKTSSDNYGIHLKLASPVSIIDQIKRQAEIVVVKPEYQAKGYQPLVADEMEEDDDEVEEGEVDENNEGENEGENEGGAGTEGTAPPGESGAPNPASTLPPTSTAEASTSDKPAEPSKKRQRDEAQPPQLPKKSRTLVRTGARGKAKVQASADDDDMSDPNAGYEE